MLVRPSVIPSDPPQLLTLGLHFLNAACAIGTRAYMRDFWASSARVPGAETYNEAVRKTEEVMELLWWVGNAWGVAGGIVGAMMLYAYKTAS